MLLQSPAYTWSMVTPHMTNLIHAGCWWLWHQICQQKGCRTSPKCPQRSLQSNWLDWQTVLWNQTWPKKIKKYTHSRYIKKQLKNENIQTGPTKDNHTQHQPNSMEKLHKIPFLKILPMNYQKTWKYEPKKLLEAFCTMPGLSISHSSWH